MAGGGGGAGVGGVGASSGVSGCDQLQLQGKALKRRGDAAVGYNRAWCYVSAALKFMQSAYLLERDGSRRSVHKVHHPIPPNPNPPNP